MMTVADFESDRRRAIFERALLAALEPFRRSLKNCNHVIGMGVSEAAAGYFVKIFVDEELCRQDEGRIPPVLDLDVQDHHVQLPTVIEKVGLDDMQFE